MNTGSLRVPCSVRVYTIAAAVILVLTLAAAAPAQMRVTIEPVLTRGPADAPVTIIEFSDYQ